MSSYSYIAVDPSGLETRGTLEVPDQCEALRRIREMGLFPTKVRAAAAARPVPNRTPSSMVQEQPTKRARWVVRRMKPGLLCGFTRQLVTLIEAGLPLLRSLRLLHEQEENRRLKCVIEELGISIENGCSFTEALRMHPKVFDGLFVSMVHAGEISGSLEVTLKRLIEFIEKAQRIKGRVKAALYYPCAVLFVATAILILLLTFIVPRFRAVFDGLMQGQRLPAFTMLVFNLSEAAKTHVFLFVIGTATFCGLFALGLRTSWGRWTFDHFKLSMPVFGRLFRKSAISRFARTLGTLIGSGVPILQALMIAQDTAGNVRVGKVIADAHASVKQGEPIAPTLKRSGIFPSLIAGMVDVGEQTGALPEMLMKIADNCDEEVNNAANALTSLLEPILIVILAVIVGSIVVAVFLPLIAIGTGFDDPNGRGNM